MPSAISLLPLLPSTDTSDDNQNVNALWTAESARQSAARQAPAFAEQDGPDPNSRISSARIAGLSDEFSAKRR